MWPINEEPNTRQRNTDPSENLGEDERGCYTVLDDCGSYAGDNEGEKTRQEQRACKILNEEAQKKHDSLSTSQVGDIELRLNSSILIKPQAESQVQWYQSKICNYPPPLTNNQNKFNSLRINIDDIETGEEGISPTIRQASSDLQPVYMEIYSPTAIKGSKM